MASIENFQEYLTHLTEVLKNQTVFLQKGQDEKI